MSQHLTPTQLAAIEADSSSFLLGPAGTGKSTALRQRLLTLLEGKEPAYTMLVMIAELEHAQGEGRQDQRLKAAGRQQPGRPKADFYDLATAEGRQ